MGTQGPKDVHGGCLENAKECDTESWSVGAAFFLRSTASFVLFICVQFLQVVRITVHLFGGKTPSMTVGDPLGGCWSGETRKTSHSLLCLATWFLMFLVPTGPHQAHHPFLGVSPPVRSTAVEASHGQPLSGTGAAANTHGPGGSTGSTPVSARIASLLRVMCLGILAGLWDLWTSSILREPDIIQFLPSRRELATPYFFFFFRSLRDGTFNIF